jgi:hypothetical protein
MNPIVVSVIGGVMLLVLGALLLAVIWKADTADERAKYGNSVLAVFCAVVGSIMTALFTHNEVSAARAEATVARNQADAYRSLLASAASTATQVKASLVDTVNSKPSTYTVGDLREDQGYKMVVNKLSGLGEIKMTSGHYEHDFEVQPKK